MTVTSGDVTFENLTIDGGASLEYGGGIYIPGQPHTVTLNNVQVVGNDAALNGGGIWMDQSTLGNQNTLILNDSVISANIANGDGGGVYVGADSILTATNTVFENNLASDGGGIYTNGTVTVSGGLLTNNDAYSGGGIYQHWSATSLTINSPTTCTVAPDVASFVPLTTFIGNDANDEAGAHGGAIFNSADATIYGTLFSDNSAENGGAIYEDSGAGLLTVGCSAFELELCMESTEAPLAATTTDRSSSKTPSSPPTSQTDSVVPSAPNTTATRPRYVVRSSTRNTASTGGAIYAQDDLILEDSELSSNAADLEGGALVGDFATIAISDSTISGNLAASGAGISTSGGSLTVTDSAINNNQAVSGLFWDFENPSTVGTISTFVGTPQGSAAGVVSGVASQTGAGPVLFLPEANPPQRSPAAGLVHITRVITDGSDLPGSFYPYIEFTNTETISLENLTFEHFHNHNSGFPTSPNYSVQLQLDSGGGYVDIGNSVFLSPSTFGRADTVDLLSTSLPPGTHRIRWVARSLASGTDTNTEYLALNDVSLSFVSGLGGGVLANGTDVSIDTTTIDGNVATEGGGLYLGGFGGLLDINQSTISNNTATGAAGTVGGGILTTGNLRLTNSTVSGNDSAGDGGGVGVTGGSEFFPGGRATLSHVTLVGNTANNRGGVFNASTFADITISNSVSEGNSNGTGGPNCFNLTSLGHNVLGGPLGCTLHPTDIVGAALVEPLADNGGPTLTHALPVVSPAVDAGFGTWQLNGVAAYDEGLLLASPSSQVGSAFLNEPVDVTQNFSASFQFRIAPQSGGGADGITLSFFDSSTALGLPGGYLGIGTSPTTGAAEGVSIEFDTWPNGVGEGANDPNGNHIGIDFDGDLSSTAIGNPIGSMSDGSVWTAWVDYDVNSAILEVRASNDGIRPVDPTVWEEVSIGNAVGVGLPVYVGFTGATGSDGISGEQRVFNFVFNGSAVCDIVDQRGVARPQGAACDAGAFELDALPTVIRRSDGAGVGGTGRQGRSGQRVAEHPRDAGVTNAADPTDDNVASAPIAGLDTQSSALESSPIAGLPIAGLPIAGLPIAGLGAAAQQVLNEILLSDIPITGGWEVHLAQSTTATPPKKALKDRPIQTVTYGEAMQDVAVLASLAGAGLTFDDLNVASTPIAGLPIAGLALGNLPIAGLPIAGLGATQTQNLQAWCDLLAGQKVNCATLGITPSNGSTVGLLDVTVAGGDISSAPIAGLPIAGLPIAGLPIAGLPIAGLVLADSPIAGLPIAGLPIAGLPIAGLPIAGLPIAGLPIAGLDVNTSPIAGLPIAGLEIDNTPIAGLADCGLADCGSPDCWSAHRRPADCWSSDCRIGTRRCTDRRFAHCGPRRERSAHCRFADCRPPDRRSAHSGSPDRWPLCQRRSDRWIADRRSAHSRPPHRRFADRGFADRRSVHVQRVV